MRILVACEESQAVTIELRKLGHEAFSCDLQECSGGHPEWHINGDVIPLLKKSMIRFKTQDGKYHFIYEWSIMIGFPMCTHLSVSGAKHFEKKREDGRQREAIDFFMTLLNAPIRKIAIENPVNIISGKYILKHFPDLVEKYKFPIKSTQRIQPYQFGDEAQKTTCLWLKGLPQLIHTNVVSKGEMKEGIRKNGETYRMPKWFSDNKSGKIRSKTFPGIAKAMAEQWTKI